MQRPDDVGMLTPPRMREAGPSGEQPCVDVVDFTVVIPAYNPGPFLREALLSVRQQIVAPAWVVVVDDGSSDGTGDAAEALLSEFGLPGQVIRQENRGISAARNAGLAARRTDWVALLDADDLWLPDHLERLRFAILHCADAVVAFGDSQHFGEPGVGTGPIAHADALRVSESSPAPGVHLLSKEIFNALLPGLFMPVSASAFRASIDGRNLWFDIGLRTGEDRYFFLQLCQLGRVVYVDRQTARTRRHANNTTHHSQEARRHEDLITLMVKINRSRDLTFDAVQRAELSRVTAAAVNLSIYSSSCNGLKTHLRARRRIASDLPSHRRLALHDLLRAVAVSAKLLRSR